MGVSLTLLRDCRFFVAVKGVVTFLASSLDGVGIDSSIGFLLLLDAAVVEAGAGEEGAEAMEDAAELGRSFNNVFTSNFRFRSRLEKKSSSNC